MQIRFLIPITATLLGSGCGSGGEAAPQLQTPYWQSSPTLPNRPVDFCRKAIAVFEGRLTDIKCQDSLGGAFGIRGKLDKTELVVIQGVNEEWFAMAYQISAKGAAGSRKSETELTILIRQIEAAFQ